MTIISQATAIDGYRWLKNDIIRGVYHPDEKLRMSLLTSRYELGVGPLREALSQLVAEGLVTVINQKGYRVAPMSEQELLDIFDARANMEAMLVRLAIERGGEEWEADLLAPDASAEQAGIPRRQRDHAGRVGPATSGVSYGDCGRVWVAVFVADAGKIVRSGGAVSVCVVAEDGVVGGDVRGEAWGAPEAAGCGAGAGCG
ncbi:Carbon starvation induced regulator [Leclercia adecarboxylata]|uniref:Carbon starvation induced regulator n=1 Tax=Leclercia adecarboxylata TaxID=83655 RepID=A0A4U9HJC8_9ENTR|nr:Carbon starvation induced regulator [Leclercia adecarboxylata]